jgi:hypothetical protein
MSERVKRLREMTVLDLEGTAVRLGEILDRGPTVLVFIRHFG